MKISVVLLIVAIFVASYVQDVDAVCNEKSCIKACKKGTKAIEVSTVIRVYRSTIIAHMHNVSYTQAFLKPIPIPQVRAAFWAVRFSGEVACNGICYMYCD